jgi:hypothetical protein
MGPEFRRDFDKDSAGWSTSALRGRGNAQRREYIKRLHSLGVGRKMRMTVLDKFLSTFPLLCWYWCQ